MEQNNFSEFPWMPSPEETKKKNKSRGRGVSVGTLISFVCLAIALTLILTYTAAFALARAEYADVLEQYDAALKGTQEELINAERTVEHLQRLLDAASGEAIGKFGKLDFLSMLFEETSYYIDSVSEEERIDAVLKAYAEATGDPYAEYYTEEEYEEIFASSTGNQVGIGVSVLQTAITVEGRSYAVFQIVSIYKNAPAEGSGVRVGDCIYGIKTEGSYQTVEELGGYTATMNLFRGEEGTPIDFVVFRPSESGYTSHAFSVKRGSFVAESVTYTTAENDPEIGIVRIIEFDLTTPTQFKEAMNALLEDGVKKFVFDVRNNLGGDLLSIKAVLSYFLNDGDLILSEIDKAGSHADSYYAEAVSYGGSYASCSVSRSELGMYGEVEMVVICNENTASAAEVFTATLRDYELATIVGEKTFGKGVMQSIFSLSSISYGTYDGYVKITTHAYVTKSGVPYHEVGITPFVEVSLSEEALQYSIYTLPQSLDSQLQAAIAQFN